MQHPGILFMRLIAPLPLGLLRALGTVLGWILYALVRPRRRVVLINLALCFPNETLAQRKRWARAVFVHFAQAFLDRAWLWHGHPDIVRKRLRMVGAVHELDQPADQRTPVVIFAPHFFGLDAGVTALSQQLARPMASIYLPQRSQAMDRWLRAGRTRFGSLSLYERKDGVKPIIAGLRRGEMLYLLPDMNYKRRESIFVPFFGIPAATVPSLPRFARLSRAKVVPVTSRMTKTGYDIEVHPVWVDYPTGDDEADTAAMNRWLEDAIRAMPDQYYWIHKRFRTRPVDEGRGKKIYAN